MAFSETEMAFYQLCSDSDFLSAKTVHDFQAKFQAEGKLTTMQLALEKFIPACCPSCKTEGIFKWYFLGKLKHPSCNMSWYVTPSTYILRQFKSVLFTGRNVAGYISQDNGWIVTLLGFVVGSLVRLPLVFIVVPVQAVVSLNQALPDSKTSLPASDVDDDEEITREEVIELEHFILKYLDVDNPNDAIIHLQKAVDTAEDGQYDRAITELDAALCTEPGPELAMIAYHKLATAIWYKFDFHNRDGEAISDEECAWNGRAADALARAMEIYTSSKGKIAHPVEFRRLYLTCKTAHEVTVTYALTKREANGKLSFREKEVLDKIQLPALRCFERKLKVQAQ